MRRARRQTRKTTGRASSGAPTLLKVFKIIITTVRGHTIILTFPLAVVYVLAFTLRAQSLRLRRVQAVLKLSQASFSVPVTRGYSRRNAPNSSVVHFVGVVSGTKGNTGQLANCVSLHTGAGYPNISKSFWYAPYIFICTSYGINLL